MLFYRYKLVIHLSLSSSVKSIPEYQIYTPNKVTGPLYITGLQNNLGYFSIQADTFLRLFTGYFSLVSFTIVLSLISLLFLRLYLEMMA